VKKTPTLVQIETRRASMERLFEGPGGSEALQQLLKEHLDSELLFDVLKAQSDAGADLYDTYDAIKTFAELDLDGNPWRLVRQDEVIDEEKHIDCKNMREVADAAECLGMHVFEDDAHLNAEVLEGHKAIEYDPLFINMLEERGVAQVAEAIAKDVASDVYALDELTSWFELYGFELRRRGSRVA
jgi:hypothetical protein